MEIKDKLIIGLLSILVVMIGVWIFGGGRNGFLGSYDESYTNFTNLKATDAFSSEGTSAITTLTATGNATFDKAAATTTIAVGGTKDGKICLWNGTNYSMIFFTSNSATTVVATSTTCR